MTATATVRIGGRAFRGENIACVRGGRLLFSDLAFNVAPGGVLFLTGPNGIGKSSLLRIMAGLLLPAAGTLSRPEGEGAPAYLGHGDGLKPLATVGESLAFWAALDGPRDAVERNDAISSAVGAFALGPLMDLPCRCLSQGQRRRVALARVTASPATLWLLDEPTTALDEGGVCAFEAVLRRHREAGGMTVIATHGKLDAEGAEILEIERFAGGDSPADPFAPAAMAGGWP